MEASEALSAKPDPKLIIPLGRGVRGKSFFLRWAVERAQLRGSDVVLLDLDRTNSTISSFFDDVLTPSSADDRDVRSFLAEFLERQIEQRFHAAIDFGGGDSTLKSVAREAELASFLLKYGVQPVAFHLLGSDPDDLSYLQALEEGVFAPPATVLILNEAAVPPHRTAYAAFQHVQNHPIFQKAISRGVKLTRMPRLEPSAEIDLHRMTFADAEAGRASDGAIVLGPFKRQQVAIWRRAMEHAFATVADWLP